MKHPAIGLTLPLMLLAPNLDALLRSIFHDPSRPAVVIDNGASDDGGNVPRGHIWQPNPGPNFPGPICHEIHPGVWFCVPGGPVPRV